MSCYTPGGIVVGVIFRPSDQRGQASVELLGTVPAVLLVGAVIWQLVLAGQAAWLCANAARVAARAEAVGGDASRAARSALPRSFEHGLRVNARADGAVHVRVRIPLLLRAWESPLSVAATARLQERGG